MYGNYFNPYTGYPQSNYSNYTNQQQSIVKVNGRTGAESYNMPVNSQALLLDESNPIVWLVQTNEFGFKTINGFDLTPHAEQKTDTGMKSIEDRLKKIEEMLYEQSNSRYSESKKHSNNNSKQQ